MATPVEKQVRSRGRPGLFLGTSDLIRKQLPVSMLIVEFQYARKTLGQRRKDSSGQSFGGQSWEAVLIAVGVAAKKNDSPEARRETSST